MFFKEDNLFADYKKTVAEGHDEKNDKNVNGIDDKQENKPKDKSVPKTTPKPQGQSKKKPDGNEGPYKKVKDTFMTKEIEKKADGSSNEKHYAQMEEATKDEEDDFHTKLDKLVHSKFGKRDDEKECEEGFDGNSFMKDLRSKGVKVHARTPETKAKQAERHAKKAPEREKIRRDNAMKDTHHDTPDNPRYRKD